MTKELADGNGAEQDLVVQAGLEKLQQGSAQLAGVRDRVANQGPTQELEDEARAILAVLRSAMDWLEDSKYFEVAHEALDEAGAFVRQTFGCWLEREGTSYAQMCPVALAHNRIGMSMGFIIERSECTICGKDPEECNHIAGRMYDGKHCARLITEGRILDVSLVARPAQPDARIQKISVPVSDLKKVLGLGFVAGMDVSCDRCLTPCDGVSRPWG